MDERTRRFLVERDKVLKLLIDEKCKGNTNGEGELSGREIVEALGMTQEHYLQIAQYLLEADLAQGDGMGGLDGGIWVTSKGIEFYEQQRTVHTVQIGAVFQGPVHGAPIQAVANAGHSSVQQIVDGVQADEVRQALIGVIEDMVRKVQEELSAEQLATYIQVAHHFQQEVAKEKPDGARLQHALSTLSFLGDLEGTIQLAERIAPYMPMVTTLLARLLSSA
jgi:hypothetical protein